MERNTILEALSDNIKIDQDKCIYCGTCVDTCILDNLRLKLAPCRQACPLGLNCQGYVQLILRGEDQEAYEVIQEKLPFASILGRICSAQCEKSCSRGKDGDQPVAIKQLKRYLADKFETSGQVLPEKQSPSGKTCAIIGSGPAGMLASYDLLLKGHAVVMYDSAKEPGGMLRWAIPEFRLSGDLVSREFKKLTDLGLLFKGGQTIGKDIELAEITEKYDAVILATGCPQAINLGLPGEEAEGVRHALEFLGQVRSGQAPKVGEQVVVIGGGEVALDTAQTAVRLGAKKATVVCLEDKSEMPAEPEAVALARSEGILIDNCWGPSAITLKQGKVSGVTLKKCISVFDAKGAFAPCFEDCQTKEIQADEVIIAVGQKRDLSLFNGATPQFNPLTLQTGETKVFLAGDLTRGPSTVVQAMASGREAAESVDRLFKDEHLSYGRAYQGPFETEYEIDKSRGSKAERVQPGAHSCSGQGDFKEIELTMSEEQAREEAGRCYSCGKPFGKFRTCWFCLPCEVECPKDALWVDIPYLLR
ncbi:FAD-dependent oxidoreductase [Dethiosulfatarculus sandiegensis]|uniref:4Fe-4S ferredoxin-type domain-containing protein n=1 Tax=Dethiosulfatarculus sandiegensis TaxID=1429043 RepID=A0A0D2GJ16_9BACT|nr:FAD-dependent oxidoreductase [Dethiosulfatarculus sandiegensis]KIX14802.1 hypothetical protein X474_06565 [Dethiosulfatarculus sandiegensis]